MYTFVKKYTRWEAVFPGKFVFLKSYLKSKDVKFIVPGYYRRQEERHKYPVRSQ